MTRFSDFDTRRYRTVDVRTGYREWTPTYEQTVEDAMDVALLDRRPRRRPRLRRRADRAWLKRHGVRAIDGVDLTPEMLALALERGLHDRLVEAVVSATGLETGAYDLVIASLVDEHLPELAPLYREAWRLAAPGGAFVLVAYHPHFIIAAGMPTHFTNDAGEPIAIDTHLHLVSDQVMAGLEAGWTLAEMREGVIEERWLALKPKWERFRGHPVSMVLAWRRAAG